MSKREAATVSIMELLKRFPDEFTFRLNTGNCEIDTIDRMVPVCSGVAGKRLPPKKVFRFYQINSKIDALIHCDITKKLPPIEPNMEF